MFQADGVDLCAFRKNLLETKKMCDSVLKTNNFDYNGLKRILKVIGKEQIGKKTKNKKKISQEIIDFVKSACPKNCTSETRKISPFFND